MSEIIAEQGLHEAAKEGDLGAVKKLLAEGAMINAKGCNGMTPLQWSAQSGHKKIVELLIAKGAEVNVRNNDGWTPLKEALTAGHFDLAELLIAKGADVNGRDAGGMTPLHLASAHGQRRCAELMIAQGAKVNTKDYSGMTPLHLASVNGRRRCAEFMIAQGAKVNTKDRSGMTPLHLADAMLRTDIVKLLLANGADVKARNKADTALYENTGGVNITSHRRIPRMMKHRTNTLSDFKDIEAARQWYAESGFDLLVDYYPEIPVRPYGSGATEANIVQALKTIKPGFILVYAKGHSGTTTFPSRLKTEHPKLAKNMPAFFRSVTRKLGIRLFMYLSGLIDGTAGMRHPEWRCWGYGQKAVSTGAAGGTFRMIGICPTSRYFEDWMAIHIEETMRFGDPDGYWFDGDWGGALCYCPRCKELFARWYGQPVKELPAPDDTDSKLGEAWQSFTLEKRHEWRRKLSDLIHRFKPTCLYSSGNVSLRADLPSHMDFNSGDCFSPNNHRRIQSIRMRAFTTLGLPYENMTCDTQYCGGLKDLRSRLKTADRMMQEGATLLANGGQWVYWTYPMPNGALIPSRSRQAGQCRKFYEARRHLFHGTQSAGRCAVITARVQASGCSETLVGACHAFIQLHRSPDIMEALRLTDDSPYELLVVPSQPNVKPETVALLAEHVRRGGILISSGSTISAPGMAELLGVKLMRANVLNEGHVILADKTPTGLYTQWDHIAPTTAGEWYPLYKSWDHDNPRMKDILGGYDVTYPITGMLDEEKPESAGFPAATGQRRGKGLALHIACDPYVQLMKFGYPQIRRWLQELLQRAQPHPWFRTDAPSWVEVALRARGDELLVHFVNGNPGRDLSLVNNHDLFVDEIPEVGPMTAWIRCSRKPREVTVEPAGKPAKTTWKNGVLQVVLERLHIHSCLVIKR